MEKASDDLNDISNLNWTSFPNPTKKEDAGVADAGLACRDLQYNICPKVFHTYSMSRFILEKRISQRTVQRIRYGQYFVANLFLEYSRICGWVRNTARTGVQISMTAYHANHENLGAIFLLSANQIINEEGIQPCFWTSPFSIYKGWTMKYQNLIVDTRPKTLLVRL